MASGRPRRRRSRRPFFLSLRPRPRPLLTRIAPPGRGPTAVLAALGLAGCAVAGQLPVGVHRHFRHWVGGLAATALLLFGLAGWAIHGAGNLLPVRPGSGGACQPPAPPTKTKQKERELCFASGG